MGLEIHLCVLIWLVADFCRYRAVRTFESEGLLTYGSIPTRSLFKGRRAREPECWNGGSNLGQVLESDRPSGKGNDTVV